MCRQFNCVYKGIDLGEEGNVGGRGVKGGEEEEEKRGDRCGNFLTLLCWWVGLRLLPGSLLLSLVELFGEGLSCLDINLIVMIMKNAGHFIRGEDPGKNTHFSFFFQI